MVRGEPPEQLGSLVGLGVSRTGRDLVRETQDTLPHRLPVLHRSEDVVEDAPDLLLQHVVTVEDGRLDVHPRLDDRVVPQVSDDVGVEDLHERPIGVPSDGELGVDDEGRSQAGALEQTDDGVDEEGAVVGDDVDRAVSHSDDRLPRGTPLRCPAVVTGQVTDGVRRSARHLTWVEVPQVAADVGGVLTGRGGRGDGLLDERGGRVGKGRHHGQASSICVSVYRTVVVGGPMPP